MMPQKLTGQTLSQHVNSPHQILVPVLHQYMTKQQTTFLQNCLGEKHGHGLEATKMTKKNGCGQTVVGGLALATGPQVNLIIILEKKTTWE